MEASAVKPKIKRTVKCSVPGCNSNSLNNADIPFHTFPKTVSGRNVYVTDVFGNKCKVDLLTAWLHNLKIKMQLKGMLVCSLHFRKEDYRYPDVHYDSKRKLLIDTAVPSLNLPCSDGKEKRKSQAKVEQKSCFKPRQHRFLKRACVNSPDLCEKIDTTVKEKECVDNLPSTTVPCSSAGGDTNCCLPFCDNGDQIEESDLPELLSLRALAEEDSDLSADTNIDGDSTLAANSCEGESQADRKDDTTLSQAEHSYARSCGDGRDISQDSVSAPNHDINEVEVPPSSTDAPPHNPAQERLANNESKSYEDVGVQVDEKITFLKYLKNDEELSTATGIESFKLLGVIVNCMKVATKNQYEQKTSKIKLDTESRVLMTYVKLKHNISYKFLSLIFGNVVSRHQCAKIFIETTLMLSKIMKSIAIPWPSRDTLRRNIPRCFKDFEDTRIVLDCTEIFIQRPCKLCCQMMTYSHYKCAQTIKFMTGVTAGGVLSFLSKPYGGRWSDSAIFEQSDLLHRLEPEDAVMVDKGFLIDEVCAKKKLRLVRPPFLRKKKFTTQQALLNKKIAKARVHVERFNQRIKVFQMLGGVFPTSLIPIIEEIFTVVCGTVNLSAPLLADDKFMGQ